MLIEKLKSNKNIDLNNKNERPKVIKIEGIPKTKSCIKYFVTGTIISTVFSFLLIAIQLS